MTWDLVVLKCSPASRLVVERRSLGCVTGDSVYDACHCLSGTLCGEMNEVFELVLIRDDDYYEPSISLNLMACFYIGGLTVAQAEARFMARSQGTREVSR